MQVLQTQARFVCPACGEHAVCSVGVPEPQWGAAEKMSDLTSEDQTDVLCNKCGRDFPAYVQNGSSGCFISLDEFPNVIVDADYAFFSPPDPEDWFDFEVPDSPRSVFLDSYHHTGDILAEHGGSNGASLINRMVFAQQVSALEAYLGDTLIKNTLEDKAALSRLLARDNDLKDQKFDLVQIAANPELVTHSVKKYLQEILYHNLAKVEYLYKCALEINFWHDPDGKKKLFQAIAYRHDCVHRNGYNKDGKRLDIFTKVYVQDIADTMKALVENIERQLSLKQEF